MINKTIKNFIMLFVGLFICSAAIVLMINANLGLSPWDVLHQGISNKINVTIGTASILVGVIVVALDVILGENIGWGTLINMFFVGYFMDLIIFSGYIPVADNVFMGIIMLILGMIVMGFGMVMYLSSGMGSGPRDGMMLALQKKSNKPVKVIRTTMEIGALIVGCFLGGKVGIGTLITAFGLGYTIQIVYKICKFKGENVNHRFIVDDLNYMKSNLSKNIK
ncbi:MAG: hypothetical protein RSG52_13320 [Terrisporobacter sp.]|uniref:YczE/YyaS/YitT family protein n=1 Tax=Terrisporobacter sp. TaxID=1965305 RepID=UPI002FC91504